MTLLDNINNFNARLLSMFQVDITDLLSNKFQMGVQDTSYNTLVIDSWYYWEYEMYVKLLNEKNKEDKEAKDKQDKEQSEKYGNMSSFNPSKIMNQYSPSNYGSKIGGGGTSAFPRF